MTKPKIGWKLKGKWERGEGVLRFNAKIFTIFPSKKDAQKWHGEGVELEKIEMRVVEKKKTK